MFVDLSRHLVEYVARHKIVVKNRVAAEMEFTGTNTGPLQMGPDPPAIPATGEQIKQQGSALCSYPGPQGGEVNTFPDAAGMMMQLAPVPSPGG